MIGIKDENQQRRIAKADNDIDIITKMNIKTDI